MDCSFVRKYLPCLTLPNPGEAPEELAEVRRHLEQCDDCRQMLNQEAASDRRIARQMGEVCVPEGLSDRIVSRLALSRPSPSRRATSIRRMQLRIAAAAAVLLAACALFVVVPALPVQRISTEELLAQAAAERDLSDWPECSRRDWPMGWSAVSQLSTQPYRMRPPLYAAAFRFRPDRVSEPVTGILWSIDRKHVRDAGDLPPLEAAQVRYGQDREVLVWSENEVVYILAVGGGGLHQLHTRLIRSRIMA